jgi:gas vesicle protein
MEEVCVPVNEIQRRGRAPSRLTGILLGGLIGAGIALLSTPYSGEKNREMLRAKGYELKEKAISTAQDTQDKVMQIARQGSEKAYDVKDRGQSIIENSKVKLQSAVEGIRTGVNTFRDPHSLEETELALRDDATLANPSSSPSDMMDPDMGTGVP